MSSLMRKIVGFVFVIFNLTTVSYATPATDLTSLLNGIHTMKANFTQTVYDNHGKAIQKATGTMALQRPGKFRWDTKQPNPQMIIANDAKIWIYDPDLAQVTIRKLNFAAGDAPALLLSHVSTSIDKDYLITRPENKTSGLTWFELQPRSNDNNYEHIKLGFLNSQIQEMNLEDRLGHSTKITFQQTKINTELASSLFQFKQTAKIDVIDETRKK